MDGKYKAISLQKKAGRVVRLMLYPADSMEELNLFEAALGSMEPYVLEFPPSDTVTGEWVKAQFVNLQVPYQALIHLGGERGLTIPMDVKFVEVHGLRLPLIQLDLAQIEHNNREHRKSQRKRPRRVASGKATLQASNLEPPIRS